MAKLSQELQVYFFEEERSGKITLANILALAGERVFGFLLVILSIPSALPVPAPGYSIPFGILIFLLSVQLIGGAKKPWFPNSILRKSLKLETAQKMVKAAIPWLKRIEAIARPRFSYICTSLAGRIIIGIMITLMAISMMIPIPGTNTIPAMGIFITAFGLQEDDGLISFVGLLVCVIGGAVSIGIIFVGVNILDKLKNIILN
jgi:hypothetical protein